MTVYRHQGKWMYDFQKNKQRYKGSGYATKQEAKDAESEARKKVGKINTDFINLCEKRLEDIELKRSTKHFKENKKLFENLILIWGMKKEVTRDDVEEYLKEVAKKSLQKANKQLRLIKALYNHGITREWFTYNPAKNIQPFPYQKKKKYVPPLKDVVAVLKLAKPLDRLYLMMVIHTLARIREINNLKWEEVKEDHLTLWTRKAKNSVLTPRDIPLNEVIKEVINDLPREGEYVFINPRVNKRTNTKTKYDYRDKFLTTLCMKAKVKVFSYHNLRHFGASLLANKGHGLKEIQELLGHQRATTTDDYLHSLGCSVSDSVRSLEEVQ